MEIYIREKINQIYKACFPRNLEHTHTHCSFSQFVFGQTAAAAGQRQRLNRMEILRTVFHWNDQKDEGRNSLGSNLN